MNDVNFRTAADLIYLVACAVNQTKPEITRIKAMDLEAVYHLAMDHMLCTAVCYALESAGVSVRAFMQVKAKMIRRTVLFETESKRVCEQLEAQKIRYLPLKGMLLATDYPAYGMREMADIDILCDPDRMEDVHKIMLSLGFRGKCLRYGKDVPYEKAPSIHFEIHRALLEKDAEQALSDYYGDIDSLLKRSEDNPYGCRMSAVEFYLYMTVHFYKHATHSGSGLRSLLDIYVHWRAHEEEIDKDVLSAKLRLLGLTEFEQKHRELAFRVFTVGELSEELFHELADYLHSAFGTEEQMNYSYLYTEMSGDDSSSAKRKMIRELFFLTDDDLMERFPFFYRHKALLPFLWVFRWSRGLLLHPAALFRQFGNVLRFKVKR